MPLVTFCVCQANPPQPTSLPPGENEPDGQDQQHQLRLYCGYRQADPTPQIQATTPQPQRCCQKAQDENRGLPPDKGYQGVTEKDGLLPVNPSGGRVGAGHVAGVSGIYSVATVVRQLREQAGGIQVPIRSGRGLVEAGDGLYGLIGVTILERS